ncbi:hypothetical protein WOLCODRAFT_136393 [Wolfiporia cocos MD-104 SS10]|uniref:Cytochrome b561 domain-containing protein n=1 Tax=Wolfiporia cocos (strain MD-104) TaxID=742152 RepID=A0A2H3JPV8_WOLCO|nr:hypothetical protein WOLCODRAFT_136393 [Wolfiporia cocos MD-104 SS10]
MTAAITLPPTPSTADTTGREDENISDAEYAPLIVEGDTSSADIVTDETTQNEKPEGRFGDEIAQIAAWVSIGVFTLITWGAVLKAHPLQLGWFFWHPVLQSLALASFTYGILTLQPTSQASTKLAGLTRHQRAVLYTGLPAILFGTLAIWVNKTLYQAPHATSWHGLFGYISVTWVVVQVLIGGGSVWFDGRLFGGNPKAKIVWKYHRASGYLCFPMLLLTAYLGGAWSDWATNNTANWVRFVAYTVALAVTFVAVLARVRLSKMKFFR